MKYIECGESVIYSEKEWRVEDKFSHGDQDVLQLVRVDEDGEIRSATMSACEWYEKKIGLLIDAVNELPKSKAKSEIISVMTKLNFKPNNEKV